VFAVDGGERRGKPEEKIFRKTPMLDVEHTAERRNSRGLL